MMILNAFYDAASKEEIADEPLVVAGLVSTEEQWVAFERAWNRMPIRSENIRVGRAKRMNVDAFQRS